MKKLLVTLLLTTLIGFVLGMLFFTAKPQVPLESLLQNQSLGSVWLNPIKYTIRGAIVGGVSANTIALLLLLTVVTAFIAGIRHLVGVRSFGIFLPAALSVVFVAIGPILGIGGLF